MSKQEERTKTKENEKIQRLRKNILTLLPFAFPLLCGAQPIPLYVEKLVRKAIQ